MKILEPFSAGKQFKMGTIFWFEFQYICVQALALQPFTTSECMQKFLSPSLSEIYFIYKIGIFLNTCFKGSGIKTK
jgi:hypothetical protein